MSYTWGALGTRRTSGGELPGVEGRGGRRREGRRGEDLAEYATLALRIDPPSVVVDNDSSPTCSVLRIDSANRPGTLIEVNFQGLCTTLHILGTHLTRVRLGLILWHLLIQVVQYVLGLGLCVQSATISSDRSWFYDGEPYPLRMQAPLLHSGNSSAA